MKPEDHYKLSEQFVAAAERIAKWSHEQNRHDTEVARAREFQELIYLADVHANLAFYPELATPIVQSDCPRRYVWQIGLAMPRSFIPVPVTRVEDSAWWPKAPTAGSGGAVNKRGVDAMTQLQDNQQVTLSVTAEDAEGDAVTDPGTRVWALDNPALASLVDNGDGTQTLVANGPVGTVTVTVTDTEPSVDGGTTPGAVFQGSLAVDIVSGPVQQIVIDAGTPVDKPATGDPTTGGPTPEESAPTAG